MSGKAARIVLSEKQQEILQQIIRATTLSQRLLQRASVILLAFEGHLNEDIDKSTLGRKGRSGILKSMASRQQFLSERSHRVRFVYLPKHTSWLNQIEIVFGIVSRRVMRRGNFKSQEHLKERLLDFIDYFNSTFAKPFQWNYTGRHIQPNGIRRPSTWKENWAKPRQAELASALVA